MSHLACATSGKPLARPWSKTCGVCRRAYASVEWLTLRIVTVLPAAGVQEHLSVPAAWAIETRECSCGAVLAARAP